MGSISVNGEGVVFMSLTLNFRVLKNKVFILTAMCVLVAVFSAGCAKSSSSTAAGGSSSSSAAVPNNFPQISLSN